MSVYNIIIISPSACEGVPKCSFIVGLSSFVKCPSHKNNPRIQRLYSTLTIKQDTYENLEAIKEQFPHISSTLMALLTSSGAWKDVAMSPGSPTEVLNVLGEFDFRILTSTSYFDLNGKGGMTWTLQLKKMRVPSLGFL